MCRQFNRGTEKSASGFGNYSLAAEEKRAEKSSREEKRTAEQQSRAEKQNRTEKRHAKDGLYPHTHGAEPVRDPRPRG